MYRYRVHSDPARLRIHPTAVVNNAIFNTGGGHITVGEYVFFGHNVCVLAGVHEVDKFGLGAACGCREFGHVMRPADTRV